MSSLSEMSAILKHIFSLSWHDEESFVEEKTILSIAKDNLDGFVLGHSKNRKMFRIIGQSGSGKTTQLLVATKTFCEKKGYDPVHLAVRNFAPLHPQYDEFLRKCGKQNIREKTNEFALCCLLATAVMAIEQGYDIIFEVTLLTDEFERFLEKCLAQNKYSNLYLCVSVNKEISDKLILSRANNKLSNESGRIVKKSSSDFFYSALLSSILNKSKRLHDRIVIWSICDPLPVFDGEFDGCYDAFMRANKMTSVTLLPEKELLDAKIDYLIGHVN